MSETGIDLAIILAAAGVVFLAFAVVFAVRKEKACSLIGGFNFFTEAQQARYDKAAIARDHQRLFTWWTAGAFLFAVLCLWLDWWAMGAALILFMISIGKEMHIDAEKAFEKYKLKSTDRE